MKRDGQADYPSSFHDSEEHRPAILAKVSIVTEQELYSEAGAICLATSRSISPRWSS
jgi:hypothetical protein